MFSLCWPDKVGYGEKLIQNLQKKIKHLSLFVAKKFTKNISIVVINRVKEGIFTKMSNCLS